MAHKDFTETIINLETGETTVRDYTQAEIDEVIAQRAEIASKVEIVEATATARQAILDRLGLTADEAALLLGAK